MIPLHPDSKPYTTFITPWVCYRYLRMPMGDAYNSRFDKINAGVQDMKRCVNDSLLHSITIPKCSWM